MSFTKQHKHQCVIIIKRPNVLSIIGIYSVFMIYLSRLNLHSCSYILFKTFHPKVRLILQSDLSTDNDKL